MPKNLFDMKEGEVGYIIGDFGTVHKIKIISKESDELIEYIKNNQTDIEWISNKEAKEYIVYESELEAYEGEKKHLIDNELSYTLNKRLMYDITLEKIENEIVRLKKEVDKIKDMNEGDEYFYICGFGTIQKIFNVKKQDNGAITFDTTGRMMGLPPDMYDIFPGSKALYDSRLKALDHLKEILHDMKEKESTSKIFNIDERLKEVEKDIDNEIKGLINEEEKISIERQKNRKKYEYLKPRMFIKRGKKFKRVDIDKIIFRDDEIEFVYSPNTLDLNATHDMIGKSIFIDRCVGVFNDINGKECIVYENDIIKAYMSKNEFKIYVVKWFGNAYPAFDLLPITSWECNGISAILNNNEYIGFEVIGNKYENPELIEEEFKINKKTK